MAAFKGKNIQVGARLQMTLQKNSAYYVEPVDHIAGLQQGTGIHHCASIYYTELIGYVDGEYLIVKTPFENASSIPISVDEQVTLRILSEVDIFTFTCKIKPSSGLRIIICTSAFPQILK